MIITIFKVYILDKIVHRIFSCQRAPLPRFLLLVTSVLFSLLLSFSFSLLLHQEWWKRTVSTPEDSWRLTPNFLPTSEHILPDANPQPNSILHVMESQHPRVSAQMSTSSAFYIEIQSLVTLPSCPFTSWHLTRPVFICESPMSPHWNVNSVRT